MTDLSGQYLGRYYLAERLGEGGMAVVYRAYDTRLERDVAIKIIRSGAFPIDATAELLKRFEREAKSLAKLSHPNIVKVHDYGEHEGSPYLVMEYLPGGTLKKLLVEPLPWQDAIRLLLPIARSVEYAHQRGILHRDIKPANILITESGEPMLSDFGIAKLFEGEQTTALTGSGMAIGTPEYMAPEQWTGTTSPQSDLYSLGIVLYEMVAGRKPYAADTPAAILIKQATEPLPSPRKFVVDLPEVLEFILIKALAKEPGDRYNDVNALIRALENLRESTQAPFPSGRADTKTTTGEASPPSSRPARIPALMNFPRRGMGWLSGGIIVALVLLLGSPMIRKWLSPSPIAIEPVTSTHTLTDPPVTGLQTPELTQAGETQTFFITPTEIDNPTPAPLPAEITDAQGVSMMLVPEGEFIMGLTSEQSAENCRLRGSECNPNWFTDPGGTHVIFLDAFYIDKFEVTNSAYRACVDAGACKRPKEINSATREFYYARDPFFDQYPVINVDWQMADTFCKWRGVRLPTEAEWEKAARGTDGQLYPSGNFTDPTHANILMSVQDTTKVGSYEKGKSPYGAYDMQGNVSEWVADWYSEEYRRNPPAINPQGPEAGVIRIIKGDAWYFERDKGYSSIGGVFEAHPNTFTNHTGFRCAQSADESSANEETTPLTSGTQSTADTGPTSPPREIRDSQNVQMMLVPEGEFTMGSMAEDALTECMKVFNDCPLDWYKDEEPPHIVYLDAFYMDKYEVTNAFYKVCEEAGACTPPHQPTSYTHSSYYGNPEFNAHPVIFVDWNQANAYCKWRGAQLPTEAQWEKAARGADGRTYPWGEGLDCTQANYWRKDGGCIGDVTVVGNYESGKSPYGIYDLAGNVWEWTADWHSDTYYQNSPISNPLGPAQGLHRVLRGGGFYYDPHGVRVFSRGPGGPDSTYFDIGFRCAKDATP